VDDIQIADPVAPRFVLMKREPGLGATEIVERMRETTSRMRIRCPAGR
jgi:hypothetical protein